MSSRFPFQVTFCVGAPRSGTTLLNSLLSEGSGCTPMLPECTFISQMIRQYHDLVHYSDKQRFTAYAGTPENLAEIYSAAIDRMVLTAVSHFEGLDFRRLVLKDPELTTHVDLIPTFFGADSKVICVVRDPREVIASHRKVQQDAEKQIDDEELVATVFNYYWIAHQSKLAESGSLHFVRFDRIVAKDEHEFAQLESYLGYPVGRQGFGKVFFEFDRTEATYSENYGKPIVDPGPSKTEAFLTEPLLERIQDVFSGYNQTYRWW